MRWEFLRVMLVFTIILYHACFKTSRIFNLIGMKYPEFFMLSALLKRTR